MSINLTTNPITIQQSSVDYNYGRISLYPSNFLTSDTASLNYSSPNIIMKIVDSANGLNVNKSFIAKKIYINNNSIHGIGDGEIIIEHKDFIGNTSKLFVVIPTNKNNNIPTTDNAINTLIRNLNDKDNIDFNFNVNLENETGYYYYNNNNDHVIVLKKAIDITDFPQSSNSNSVFNSSNVTDIYEASTNAMKTDRGVVNSMSSKEDQIYIDCQPTGVSKETISSYNVPINSEYTENSATINFERSTTTIVFFGIACLMGYLVGPLIYKAAIINNIIRHIGNAKGYHENDDCKEDVSKHEQLLGGVDILLIICIFWIFSSMLSVGVISKTSIATASIYFLFLAISLMFGIYNSRQDKEYMSHETHNGDQYTLYEWFFEKNDTTKKIDTKCDYSFMNYNIAGIGKVVAEIFNRPNSIIALALIIILCYVGAYVIFDDTKTMKNLYSAIIIPHVFIVYIIFILAGLKKEASTEEASTEVDQGQGFFDKVRNFFSNPTEANTNFNGMVMSGGGSDNEDEFGSIFGGLLGMAAGILGIMAALE